MVSGAEPSSNNVMVTEADPSTTLSSWAKRRICDTRVKILTYTYLFLNFEPLERFFKKTKEHLINIFRIYLFIIINKKMYNLNWK